LKKDLDAVSTTSRTMGLQFPVTDITKESGAMKAPNFQAIFERAKKNSYLDLPAKLLKKKAISTLLKTS
jgi:hypothetical protein